METKRQTKTQNSSEQEVEVLYQRLANHWFAFSLVNDEVFMTQIPDEMINKVQNKKLPEV